LTSCGEYEKDGVRFDVVLLDPPAFARSRKNGGESLAGYKEINLRAMKVIRPGEIPVHVILLAARDLGRV
jgi:23S rRNA (cytosine1962-C5)-methyltransferase